MKELYDFETAMRVGHGAYRDVNFEGATWAGVHNFLDSLDGEYDACTASDGCDTELQPPYRSSAIAAAKSGTDVHLSYNEGSDLFAHFQVYFFQQDDGSPYIELTFFPEDLRRTETLKQDFLSWLSATQRLLEAQRCYCRHENAAWRFGETGPMSGVSIVLE